MKENPLASIQQATVMLGKTKVKSVQQAANSLALPKQQWNCQELDGPLV